MNYINKYNNEKGAVEISDNIRKYYILGFGARNRKWRWYIFFCAVSEIFMNEYIIYIFIQNMYGTPSKKSDDLLMILGIQ